MARQPEPRESRRYPPAEARRCPGLSENPHRYGWPSPPHQFRRRSTFQGTRGVFLRSEEHTSELQSQSNLVCRLLLEKKKHTSSDRDPVPPERPHLRTAAPACALRRVSRRRPASTPRPWLGCQFFCFSGAAAPKSSGR